MFWGRSLALSLQRRRPRDGPLLLPCGEVSEFRPRVAVPYPWSTEMGRSLCLISEGTKRMTSVSRKELRLPGRAGNKPSFIPQLPLISFWHDGVLPRGWPSWGCHSARQQSRRNRHPSRRPSWLRVFAVPLREKWARFAQLCIRVPSFSPCQSVHEAVTLRRFFHYTHTASGATKDKLTR